MVETGEMIQKARVIKDTAEKLYAVPRHDVIADLLDDIVTYIHEHSSEFDERELEQRISQSLESYVRSEVERVIQNNLPNWRTLAENAVITEMSKRFAR